MSLPEVNIARNCFASSGLGNTPDQGEERELLHRLEDQMRMFTKSISPPTAAENPKRPTSVKFGSKVIVPCYATRLRNNDLTIISANTAAVLIASAASDKLRLRLGSAPSPTVAAAAAASSASSLDTSDHTSRLTDLCVIMGRSTTCDELVAAYEAFLQKNEKAPLARFTLTEPQLKAANAASDKFGASSETARSLFIDSMIHRLWTQHRTTALDFSFGDAEIAECSEHAIALRTEEAKYYRQLQDAEDTVNGVSPAVKPSRTPERVLQKGELRTIDYRDYSSAIEKVKKALVGHTRIGPHAHNRCVRVLQHY